MSELITKLLLDANASLSSALAGSLPTDEPLLVNNMREARTKIEDALAVIRTGAREGWK